MPVVKEPFASTINIRYQAGVNAKGDPIIINRVYNGVKVEATDQNAFDVAEAISNLQSRSLVAIYRTDHSELLSE